MTRQLDDLVRIAEQAEQRRADKVATFLEMLRDPDLAPLVSSLINIEHSTNGKRFVPPKGFKNGNGIREAIRALYSKLPPQFTSLDVHAFLRNAHFRFSARDEKNAVRDALAAMAKNGELKVVAIGSGGKPNVYERA